MKLPKMTLRKATMAHLRQISEQDASGVVAEVYEAARRNAKRLVFAEEREVAHHHTPNRLVFGMSDGRRVRNGFAGIAVMLLRIPILQAPQLGGALHLYEG